MTYKLLALDIDGTLLNSQSQLTARTIAAVRAASATGMKVCLVSGRRARSMVPYARQLGIHDPLVCYNGGSIVLPDTLRSLHATCIPRAAVLPIIQAWEDAGISTFAFRNTADPPDVHYSGHSDWPPQISYIAHEADNARWVASLVEEMEWDPLRVYMYHHEPLARQAAALAQPLLDQSRVRPIFTRHYDGSWFFELYSAQATKASGLQWLGRHFGVQREEIVAVGDHINDLDMIEYAGLGVAMGNAQPEVKALAKLVIGDHDRDGLAEFIETTLLRSHGKS